jgi:hypothetical protein
MSLGYESAQFTIPPGYVNPISAAVSGGCQQAASNGVIGYDANVTASLPYQGIGLPQVAAGSSAFTPFDGNIP